MISAMNAKGIQAYIRAENAYTPDSEENTKPDFKDYLRAAQIKAEKKFQRKTAEAAAPPKQLTDDQLVRLRNKYKNMDLSELTVTVDFDQNYAECSAEPLKKLMNELVRMGVITEKEAAYAGGMRPMPKSRSSSDSSDGLNRDYSHSGAWLDLLYPDKSFSDLYELLEESIEKITALRSYNSNPTAAVERFGEYFSFDPSEIKDCLNALVKVKKIAGKIFKK